MKGEKWNSRRLAGLSVGREVKHEVAVRMIPAMQGLHLMADLRGCAANLPAMTEPDALRALCLRAVHDGALTPVGELFHRFGPPGGVTGVVLLAESHLAVHTWPELGAVTLDVYVCNYGADNSARAQGLLAALQQGFSPAQVVAHSVVRGEVGDLGDQGNVDEVPAACATSDLFSTALNQGPSTRGSPGCTKA